MAKVYGSRTLGRLLAQITRCKIPWKSQHHKSRIPIYAARSGSAGLCLRAPSHDAGNDGNNESAESSDDFVTVLRVFEKLK